MLSVHVRSGHRGMIVVLFLGIAGVGKGQQESAAGQYCELQLAHIPSLQ
jgi:hypothetical protein